MNTNNHNHTEESREALLGRILTILSKLPTEDLKLIILYLERRYGT